VCIKIINQPSQYCFSTYNMFGYVHANFILYIKRMWPGALPTYPRNFFRHRHILPLLLHQAIRVSSFWLQPASCTILRDKEHWPVNVWIREESEVAGSNAVLNTGNTSRPHPASLLSRPQQRQITSTSIAFQAFYHTVIILKKNMYTEYHISMCFSII
jgi:hypothetical protein